MLPRHETCGTLMSDETIRKHVAMTAPIDAASIPPQTREQSRTLALTEAGRFIDLLEMLEGNDWNQPTDCALWSVRDIVAHQASHVQMGTGLGGFLAQINPVVIFPYIRRGMAPLDAVNQGPVEARKIRPTAELIAEIRTIPAAIEARQKAGWLARLFPVPLHPVGFVGLGTLWDRIFPRDMWMHRHDIASATGKPFAQTIDHDGIIVAQTVRDAAAYLSKKQPDITVILTLHGVSGGVWRIGKGGQTVNLAIGAVDFMRRSSERLSVDETLATAVSDSSVETTRAILSSLLAPY